MTTEHQPELSQRRGRPFQKGQSGNPLGRPKGSRNKTTLMAQERFDGQAEALVDKAVELALEGDRTCLRLCLERLVPRRKDLPIDFNIPEMGAISDIPKFFASIRATLDEGGITPSEAKTLLNLAEAFHKLIESAELESRISALEQNSK